jgi:hypothetical protein
MKTIKLSVLAVLSMLCVAQVEAQQTNLVQTFSIQLFGFSQGGSNGFGNIVTTNINSVRVDSRQVIQALAVASFDSFSSTSRLVLVTPLNGGSPQVQIRDGNNIPVDVTDFFDIEALSDSINGSISNTKTGRGSSITYEIGRFALQDAHGQTLSLHFNVDGVVTGSSSSPFFGPASPQSSTIDANVAGSGDKNGNFIILQGSINIFGRTLEVVSGGGVS